jgi:hypothetical protein
MLSGMVKYCFDKCFRQRVLSREACAVRQDLRTNDYALQQVVGQPFHASSTARAAFVAGASPPCTAGRADKITGAKSALLADSIGGRLVKVRAQERVHTLTAEYAY